MQLINWKPLKWNNRIVWEWTITFSKPYLACQSLRNIMGQSKIPNFFIHIPWACSWCQSWDQNKTDQFDLKVVYLDQIAWTWIVFQRLRSSSVIPWTLAQILRLGSWNGHWTTETSQISVSSTNASYQKSKRKFEQEFPQSQHLKTCKESWLYSFKNFKTKQ